MNARPLPPSWHALAVEQVFGELGSSGDGLTSAEARARLLEQGPNRIERGPRRSVMKILVRQLADPLVYVLIAAGLVAVLMGKVTDGLVVLAVPNRRRSPSRRSSCSSAPTC